MVYNPVIISLPLQGDGMVGEITRRLTGGKILYLTTNCRQETKKKNNREKKTRPV